MFSSALRTLGDTIQTLSRSFASCENPSYSNGRSGFNGLDAFDCAKKQQRGHMYQDTASGETCSLCGYTDGHNVLVCPLVLSGRAKKMPGLSREAVARLAIGRQIS